MGVANNLVTIVISSARQEQALINKIMDSKEGEEIESKEEPKDIDQEKVASNAEGGDKDGSTIGDDDMPQGSTAGEYDPNHPQSEQTAQAQGEEKTPVKNKEEGGEEEPAENPISPTEGFNKTTID